MFVNYIKIAARNLMKFKVYSFINITGLAVGIACSLLILLYVQDELSYDRFHQKADRIFRVISLEKSEDKENHVATTYAPLAPILETENSEIKEIVRFLPHSVVVKSGELKFQEDKFFFCDPDVFNVFSFAFESGDPRSALAAPNSVVLTEETARRYFGSSNPMGQTLRIENQLDLTVTGVLKNLPHNSHLHFDFLTPLRGIDFIIGRWVLTHGWHWPPIYTYITLPGDLSVETLENRFPQIVKNRLPESMQGWVSFHLQKLTDIHLHSSLQNEIEPQGSMTYVIILSLIAIFILFIACINFTNLATARSANRAKEVGLRKVVGAEKGQLVRQFLGESFVYALIAMLLAILTVVLALPAFNHLIGKQLSLYALQTGRIWLGLIGITLIVGLMAGGYPALLLSRFRPVQILQGGSAFGQASRSPNRLRSALVIVQFAISITLIIITAGVHKQLGFIQNNRLGFNKEHIVVVPIRDENLQNKYETLKNRILSNAGIVSATAISNFPWDQGYYGFPIQAEGMSPDNEANIATLIVDPDFTSTFGIDVLEGRSFSKGHISDAGHAFIVNQAAVQKLGWDSAIGKRFTVQKITSGKDMVGQVVGVIRDFHLRSLHHEIDPLVAVVSPLAYYLDNLAVRIAGHDVRSEVAVLEKTWNELVPHRPFEYFFLDEAFDQLYRKEQKLGEIFNYFAMLIIIVSCLGLFGLASFTAEHRTKEIGIRKTLGAPVFRIVLMLSKDFSLLVGTAFFIAAPMAYYFIHQWLQDFAYKAMPNLWTFLLAGGLALSIAMITVSVQTVRAALTNPVESLRHE